MQQTGVSVHFVQALLDPALDRGFDGDALLRQSLIEPSCLGQPSARVSAASYASLMRAVAQALDDEFFGRDSRRMKQGSFAMLCHAVMSCGNLSRALARAVRFYGLMLDDVGFHLQEGDGQLQILLDPKTDKVDLFAHENLLLFLHRLACWLVNRRLPLSNLAFACPRPPHDSEYRLIFSIEPTFDQPLSRLALDSRYGALPLVRNEASLKEFLALAPENLFVRYRPSHGTVHRVRRHLASMAPGDWPSLAQLARSLGMSSSTLHRRLAAEDSSFQALKDQLRRERAMSLLRGGDHSVMAIAEELGFAEASAFHRAFRKWSGRPPGKFRHGVRAEKDLSR